MKTVLLFGGVDGERRVATASAQNVLRHFEFSEVWFFNPQLEFFREGRQDLLSFGQPFEQDYAPRSSPIVQGLDPALYRHWEGQVVFLALHGRLAEDGIIQEFLEKGQVAFTASGSEASRKAFLKDQAKEFVAQAGLNVAPQRKVTQSVVWVELLDIFESIGPLVIKPVASGSSLGLFFVSQEVDLRRFFQWLKEAPEAQQIGAAGFLAEAWIRGREFTVGVLDQTQKYLAQALPPSEVVLQTGRHFDYAGKYLGQGVQEITPAQVDASLKRRLQEVALRAHRALGCYGYSRTDMIYDPSGDKIYFLETNTLPGLTPASFLPQQLQAQNISLLDFIMGQLELAQRRYDSRGL